MPDIRPPLQETVRTRKPMVTTHAARSRSPVTLLRAARAGDPDAIGRLLADHYAHVQRVVSHRVRASDVDEVAHDAVVRAFESIDQLRDPSRFRQWLTQIANHVAVDSLRRRYRHADVETLEEDVDLIDDGLERQAGTEFALPVLMRAIVRLKPPHATTLLLRGLEGFSYRRIAHEMRISLPCVKSYLYRARQSLREGWGRDVSAIRTLAAPPNLR